MHSDFADGTVYMVCAGAGADSYSSGNSTFTQSSHDYKSGGAIGLYGVLTADAKTLTIEAHELRVDGSDPVFDTSDHQAVERPTDARSRADRPTRERDGAPTPPTHSPSGERRSARRVAALASRSRSRREPPRGVASRTASRTISSRENWVLASRGTIRRASAATDKWESCSCR